MAVQKGMWNVARTLPATKKTSVTTSGARPAPA